MMIVERNDSVHVLLVEKGYPAASFLKIFTGTGTEKHRIFLLIMSAEKASFFT